MFIRKTIIFVAFAVLLGGLWLNGFNFIQNWLPDTRKNIGPEKKQVSKDLTPLAGKIEPIDNKTLIGVYDPKTVKGQTKFESVIDTDAAVVATFQTWSDDTSGFPRKWVDHAIKNKKLPMITWEPWEYSQTDFDQPRFRLKTIVEGKYDTHLRKWLTAARDSRGPIFVRFAHEMNGNWYPWGSHVNSPEDYVRAWRHIVDLSREIGATNITWVWSPNEVAEQDVLDHFYPGDEYVDWIGASGFNWPGLEAWQKWRSFSQIYTDFFNQVRKYEKPLMVAEIAAAENPRGGPQTRAAWITETLASVRSNDPPIALFVWFNDRYTSGDKVYVWSINESTESIEAMKNGLANPAFVNNYFTPTKD